MHFVHDGGLLTGREVWNALTLSLLRAIVVGPGQLFLHALCWGVMRLDRCAIVFLHRYHVLGGAP